MTASILAFTALFLLLFLGLPIGLGMGIVGVAGFAWMIGLDPALNMLGQTAYDTVLSYNLSVLPLFILMGHFVSQAGLSRKLFEASYAWVGHFKGGLAVASILSCGGFSTVCGSSMATAATMGRVVIPAMRKYGYEDGFAAGSVAAGGTLGILIPPSVLLVMYGLLTEQDIGALFAAGLIPGVLGILLYSGAAIAVAALRPGTAPAGERSSWAVRFRALKGVIGIAVLFGIIMVGIYGGVFTPTEAAAIGAVGAFFFALLSGELTFTIFRNAVVDTVLNSCTIFLLVIGAIVFTNFVNVAGFSQAVGSFISTYDPTPLMIILALVVTYLILGCFLESMSMILLTVPVFYPIMAGAGFDLIWFGVFVVILMEISLITPPVGLNIFVLNSAFPSIGLSKMFRGVLPFIAADIVRLALVIFLPGLVTILPSIFY